MDIQTLLYPGKYHRVYCEDHLFYHHVSNEWFVGAVMDGCSSGEESHFASGLYVKSIRKSCREMSEGRMRQDETNLFAGGHEGIGRRILHGLFEDMQRIHRDLALDIFEMLSTLLLLVYRTRDRSAWINASGDGLIINNGEYTEIDQQNMPDYMAYHMDLDAAEWHRNHTRSYVFENVRDLTISTDGLFRLHPDPADRSIVKDPVSYLFDTDASKTGKGALQQILMELIHRHNCIPYDDIGVIRILP